MLKNQMKTGSNKTQNNIGVQPSVWTKAITQNSQWDDKDEFLDVIYWSKQIFGVIAGILWGLFPLKGFIGIALFLALNAGITYLYFTKFQQIDEEEYGGAWEITKEGFMSSFAGFLVLWIIIYTGVHHS